MKSKQYLGLDIGSSGTKAVALDKNGVLCGFGSLDMRDEGILNDAELYGSIAKWIDSMNWGKCRTITALPQYMATILSRNYPEKLPEAAINLQLKLESSQVAGLSDEPMLQDCCILGKTPVRTNAVVIAISKEQNIRERLATMETAGIKVTDIVPGGIAIVNAFNHLYPKHAECGRPALLVELGNEYSTAVVIAGGQPLFMGSLMFSAEKINEIIKRRGEEHNTKMPERDMKTINIRDENSHSCVMEALFSLENEIHDFIESWRSQETEDMAQIPVENVYICGGLSQMQGLQQWLQERLEVEVSILAPDCSGELHPELIQAYGLALQSAGRAHVKLFMLPEDIRFSQYRAKNWPALAMALLLILLAFVAIDLHCYRRNIEKLNQFKAEKADIETCIREISTILDLQKQLKESEMKLAPIVAAGNQHTHLCSTLGAMASARGEKDWFIYLADEHSYQRYKDNSTERNKTAKKNTGNLFSWSGTSSIGDTAGRDEFPHRYEAANVTSSKNYIAAGYTPQVFNEPYKPVGDILHKMNETGLFAKADIMTEKDRIGREDIFMPWISFLKNVPGGQFKAFTVRLPLKTTDILATGINSESSQNEEE